MSKTQISILWHIANIGVALTWEIKGRFWPCGTHNAAYRCLKRLQKKGYLTCEGRPFCEWRITRAGIEALEREAKCES